jgi:hypothetical protein
MTDDKPCWDEKLMREFIPWSLWPRLTEADDHTMIDFSSGYHINTDDMNFLDPSIFLDVAYNLGFEETDVVKIKSMLIKMLESIGNEFRVDRLIPSGELKDVILSQNLYYSPIQIPIRVWSLYRNGNLHLEESRFKDGQLRSRSYYCSEMLQFSELWSLSGTLERRSNYNREVAQIAYFNIPKGPPYYRNYYIGSNAVTPQDWNEYILQTRKLIAGQLCWIDDLSSIVIQYTF